jgi:hypothetical protein
MYTEHNYKTKKALREAVAGGKTIRVWQPGPFPAATDGVVVIEGPQYPEPHRWYAQATIVDGIIKSVK